MGLYEGIKDVAKVVQQADNIDLYKKLLDLSAQALDQQAEIARLKAENEELRKGKDLEATIIRHQNPYLTFSDDTIQVKYCALCWGNEQKLMQMREQQLDSGIKLYCHKCGNSCRLDT